MRSFFLLVAMLVMAVCWSPASRGQDQSGPTYAQAMANCQQWLASTGNDPRYGSCQAFVTPSGAHVVCAVVPTYGHCYTSNVAFPDSEVSWTMWYYTGAAPGDCSAGQVIPAGTTVQTYAASGDKCLNGCSVAMTLGDQQGPNGLIPSGTFLFNGSVCASQAGDPAAAALKPPVVSETTNADGSKTYCDTVSGKCRTSRPIDPAPSSSVGSHSTDSSSSVNTPASSSSSTSTTTPSGDGGDGTGGSGGGSGSASGSTTTTKTDTPASSSSVATKCTTGVCDVGSADGALGSLYTASSATPASVYADFASRVSASPIISAASGFFQVTVGGSCPSWHIPGNEYWGEAGFDFSFFCDPAILALLTYAGYLVLAVAAFAAFKVAVY